MEKFSREIREEIEGFEETKREEIQNAMVEFVQSQMRYVLQMKDQWQQLMMGITAKSEEINEQ